MDVLVGANYVLEGVLCPPHRSEHGVVFLRRGLVDEERLQDLRRSRSRCAHGLVSPCRLGVPFFFILELVVVILAMKGSRSLVRRDFIYLFVDAVVVFFGVLEVVFTLCGITSSFLKNFRLLKLMRLGELPHTLKNANFCGKLTRMISALTHSVENLFWGCVLLLMIASGFAMLFLSLLTEYVSEATADDEVVEQLRPFFSSIPRSILTSLMCVTGGLSWWEVERHFLEVSYFLAVMFVASIFIMFFAVLNVFTSIFVLDAVGRADADPDVALTQQTTKRNVLRAALTTIFNDIDANHCGEITQQALKEVWNCTDVQTLLSFVGIEALDHTKFFEALDTDRSGKVSIEEFIVGIHTLAGQAKQMDLMVFQAELKMMMDSLAAKQDDIASKAHKMMNDIEKQQVQAQVTQQSIMDKLSQHEVVF